MDDEQAQDDNSNSGPGMAAEVITDIGIEAATEPKEVVSATAETAADTATESGIVDAAGDILGDILS